MERLTIAMLALTFLLNGSGLTFIGLISYLYLGVAPLNNKTILALWALLTHYMYGVSGIVYSLLTTLTLVVNGLMYWYDLSLDDIRKKATGNLATEFGIDIDDKTQSGPKDSTTSTTSDNAKIDELTNNDAYSTMSTKIDRLGQYKNLLADTLRYKLGITDEKMTLIKTNYSAFSTKFDTVTDVLFTYIVKFRAMTKNVMGLKTIYYVCDCLCNILRTIETVKSLNVMTRKMQNQMSAKFPHNDLKPNNKSSNMFTSDLSKFDDLMKFDDLKKFDDMTPEEKQQADKIAFEMMKNLGMDEQTIKMMQQMEAANNPKMRTNKNKGTTII